jgi:hypothetical protein
MAEQADRVYKRKRIKKPTDDSVFVDIPILTQAKFVTAAEQYQDRWVYLKNDSSSHRKTRIQRVTNPNSGDYVDVERLGSFFVKTLQEQAQEYEYIIKNDDPAPIQPDGSDNPAHEKKHVVRFYPDNDTTSGTWADLELIDELKITSATEQYQEYRIILRNPDPGDPAPDSGVPYDVTVGFCDSSLELYADDEGFDPPYRLDPFRNIVNINFGGGIPGYGVPRGSQDFGLFITPDGSTLSVGTNPNSIVTLYTQSPANTLLHGTLAGMPSNQSIGISGDKFFSAFSWSGTTLNVTVTNHTGDTESHSFDFGGMTFTCSDDMAAYPGHLAYPGVTWVQAHYNNPPAYSPPTQTSLNAITIVYKPTALGTILYPPTTFGEMRQMYDEGDQGYVGPFP